VLTALEKSKGNAARTFANNFFKRIFERRYSGHATPFIGDHLRRKK
jgi:hypothetical protein